LLHIVLGVGVFLDALEGLVSCHGARPPCGVVGSCTARLLHIDFLAFDPGIEIDNLEEGAGANFYMGDVAGLCFPVEVGSREIQELGGFLHADEDGLSFAL